MFALLLLMLSQPIHAAFIDLTDLTGVGQPTGNQGTSYSPGAGNLTITARADIDFGVKGVFELDSDGKVDAPGDTGTVVFSAEGAGVQDIGGGGSTGISGKGGNKNEELIFTFGTAVTLGSIELGLNKIDFCVASPCGDETEANKYGDQPVIFLGLTDGSFLTVFEDDIFDSFMTSGTDIGKVLFGAAAFLGSNTGLTGTTLISSFIIRNTGYDTKANPSGTSFTKGEFYVNSVTSEISVPEPTTLVLMSLGLIGLGFSRRKRLH